MKPIPGLSPQQNLIVGAAVRAVADETMEDALARAVPVRAGRRPDCEQLLLPSSTGFRDASPDRASLHPAPGAAGAMRARGRETQPGFRKSGKGWS